jgi:hypothetical protein
VLCLTEVGMLIFIYDNVTSIKPKFHPKAFKFVEETHFGKATSKRSVITPEHAYQYT